MEKSVSHALDVALENAKPSSTGNTDVKTKQDVHQVFIQASRPEHVTDRWKTENSTVVVMFCTL